LVPLSVLISLVLSNVYTLLLLEINEVMEQL